MAERGDLPKRICKASDPMCASCQYGQATRRPWRTKSTPKSIEGSSKVTGPGDCISVDQMQSPVPGLIAQNKGSPTRERYMAATIFVDHYSDVTFVHLQKTLNAKEAFERWANSHSVKIKHYHADNGRFAKTDFMAHVAKSGQTISFCGVNPHFQNGRAERRIQTLQDLGRTQLLHAIARWLVAISHHLWPFAVGNVGQCLNDTARPGEEKTRIERFTGSDVRPNVKDQHHLGCPAYVLDSDMQSGKNIPKWMPRARVGIYLGKSPRHARNVSLVLNPRTGMVSPQYHMKIDDTFETVVGVREATHGTWREKCGFRKESTKKTTEYPGAGRRLGTRIEKEDSKKEGILKLKEAEVDEVNIDQSVLPPDFGNEEPMQEHEGDVSPSTEATEGEPTTQPELRRSTRRWKPTQRYLESVQQEGIELRRRSQYYDRQRESHVIGHLSRE
jgi:hypothetical protein